MEFKTGIRRIGEKDRYVCNTCGGSIVTEVKHDGLLPFATMCKADLECEGIMFCREYNVEEKEGEPVMYWRKPNITEFLNKHPAAIYTAIQNHFIHDILDLKPS